MDGLLPVGAVIELAEGDYCYGHGTLRLRVVESFAVSGERNEPGWLWVAGHEIGWSGRAGSGVRGVLVPRPVVDAWRQRHGLGQTPV